MDTTETYIKMSEKAEEIQEKMPRNTGDVVVVRHDIRNYNGWQSYDAGDIEIVGNDGEYDVTFPDKDDFIWLPRQDQLQDMVDSHIGRYYTFRFGENDKMMQWNGETSDWYCYGESMEQLWLAFVMKEKYNKVWNGEEWELSQPR